jgi:integrase
VFQALAAVDGLRRGRSEARETPPVGPVDDEIVEATLQFVPPMIADMAKLQRRTGMRPHEVCIVRPSDIDRSGPTWLYRPQRHKTEHHGRERVIQIGPRGQEVLLKYLVRPAESHCFRPCESEEQRREAASAARKVPQSCGNTRGSNRKRRPKRQPGECYATNSYRKAITRGCERAFPHPTLSDRPEEELSIPEKAELYRWRQEKFWSPNQLRHSFATEVRKLYGLEAAQVLLGHSSANVTQIYAERDMERGATVALAIG